MSPEDDKGVTKPREGVRGLKGRPVAVRKATPGDVPLVLQFVRELAAYERMLGEVEATEDGLRRTLFPAGGAPPAAHVLIGEIGGVPAGFAVYFFNYSTFLARPGLYLEDIFVRPESRGNGLGKALLLHLAKLAADMGCGRMEWAVLDWTTSAIDFYKRIGAVALGDWTVYRLDHAALQGLRDEAGPRA